MPSDSEGNDIILIRYLSPAFYKVGWFHSSSSSVMDKCIIARVKFLQDSAYKKLLKSFHFWLSLNNYGNNSVAFWDKVPILVAPWATAHQWWNGVHQSGCHKVGEKNSRSFPGFSRATNLLFHGLSQQKVNVIMTIKGHSTITPAV